MRVRVYPLSSQLYEPQWQEWSQPRRQSPEHNHDIDNTNKYSFHKNLALRLATNYSWCLLNKPLHISKADTNIFIGGFQTKMRGAGFIPFLGWNTILKHHKIGGHSFICTLQCILLPCDTVCVSAVFRMTAHDICTNNAHGICANFSSAQPNNHHKFKRPTYNI